MPSAAQPTTAAGRTNRMTVRGGVRDCDVMRQPAKSARRMWPASQ
ncbi:hypothetical protein R0J89_16335 [Psychrobacter sp. SIMBA_152]